MKTLRKLLRQHEENGMVAMLEVLKEHKLVDYHLTESGVAPVIGRGLETYRVDRLFDDAKDYLEQRR